MEPLEIIVGHVYRSKKPKGIGIMGPLTDDRQVVFTDGERVQYDGPVVKMGRRLPFTTIEKSRKWAARDVTHEMPPDAWADFPPK